MQAMSFQTYRFICADDEISYQNRKKFVRHLDEMDTYIRNNRHLIPNYGETWRYGETITTAFVESTINEVVVIQLQAVGVTRQRCWRYDYVLEFNVKGLFDAIDHALLLREVYKHTDCRWVRLYIERWLKAPFQQADGGLVERNSGSHQGGVVSPVLSNL